LGAQSDDLGKLADASSRTWSLGGSLLAPLFTGDRLEAARDAQLARAEAAAEDWRAAVVAAWTEVEAGIVELRREREREAALVAQAEVESRALVLARDRHENGLVDYFEVLAARRSLVFVEQELARSRTQLALKTVALLRAIGGQWRAVDE
jgi:outer membrane protein TolC